MLSTPPDTEKLFYNPLLSFSKSILEQGKPRPKVAFNLRPFPLCFSKGTMNLVLKSDHERGQSSHPDPNCCCTGVLWDTKHILEGCRYCSLSICCWWLPLVISIWSQRHKIAGNAIHRGQPLRQTAWQRTEKKDNGNVMTVTSGN